MEGTAIEINSGGLIISLDFELNWGVHDVFKKGQYDENLLGVREALPKILAMFEKYEIHATWATVGLLFAENKQEMKKYLDLLTVQYKNMQYAAHTQFDFVGENEQQDPLHYGLSLIQQINATPNQEIGTHTFSHFYCLEDGQIEADFRADLIAAKKIQLGKFKECESIVFPRNQVNPAYLDTCREMGLTSYRGNEKHFLYRATKFREKSKVLKLIRLMDSYIRLSGHHIMTLEEMNDHKLINIQSSAFLRPYMRKLKWFEGLKVKRIKASMLAAAKQGSFYHLWWHPHNFGKNTLENLKMLEEILEYYSELKKEYHFQSYSMKEIVTLCQSKKQDKEIVEQ